MLVHRRAVAALLVLVAAASAVLVQPRVEAGTPTADVSAFYEGKGSSQTSVITEGEGGGGGFLAEAVASQEGNDLLLTIVIDPDGDAEVWSLQGRVGNGRFWVSGDVGEGDRVVLTGTAKGTPGKLSLKGKGFYTAPDHYSSFGLSLRQTASPE
jgi:hypothetical protein